MLRELDRLARRVRSGARDHGHAAARLIDAPLDHQLVLVMRQRRALPGSADGHQALGAFHDLPFDKVAERFLVERTVLEGRHKRRERSAEARLRRHDWKSRSELNEVQNTGSRMGMKANVLGVRDQRNRWLLRPHSRRFLMAKMRRCH
jgi:hypothetical protein